MDSSMSGMDSSSDPMFRGYNQVLARGFWYIVAFIVATFLLLRVADHTQNWFRCRRARTRNIQFPTKVANPLEQVYATTTAILRELSYPQVLLENRYVAWLSPPPLGRALFLACYWAIILFMMTHNAVKHDAYYWERIGFRNAWISVTQVPLVYLLASKSSLIGFIIGSSHERLNWLHRWVSRTLLVTVTIHGGFFMAEWVRADFVKLELTMMPMVKYGIGAWAILVWTFISSLSPLRSIAYEVFVLQHIAAAAVFLWCLWVHVPRYASYNVWFAIGALSFDWVLRMLLLFYRNIRLRKSHSCSGTRRIGHQVEVQAIGANTTVVTIKDVHMSWKPGQHLKLWVPRLGPFESHPFTIATPCKTTEGCHCNEIQLAIKCQAGFSRRIYKYALKTKGNNSLIGFIAGPFGTPPQWKAYETLVLISASTGASFTLPILDSILNNSGTICTKRIRFLLLVRQRTHIEFYVKRLSDALARAETLGIGLDVEIAITGDEGSQTSEDDRGQVTEEQQQTQPYPDDIKEPKKTTSQRHPHSTSIDLISSTSNECCCSNEERKLTSDSKNVRYTFGRPDISTFIRKPVEATGGETSVAICGGKSLVASVRNCIARLSDERAVHKGTGAQGIHLHVEEYCF